MNVVVHQVASVAAISACREMAVGGDVVVFVGTKVASAAEHLAWPDCELLLLPEPGEQGHDNNLQLIDLAGWVALLATHPLNTVWL